LLVTSRELLRISGEVEYPVPPLAEPEAVALFCERAQTEPTEEIAELCRHLDSLPLAVELAAARMKALTPAQILERLSSRLDLLKGGRDADPRQQTLRATIEWSYDLLTPDEQQLFAWLSVFSGGCTLEAAEDVCNAEIDTLQSLVEKSLLRFTSERYWMLETIREYAAEQLDESEDATGIRDVHAAWFLALAAEAGAEKYTDRQIHWLSRLEEEHDNLRAALAHFQAAHAPQNEIALVCEIGWFWLRHGHWREAYEQALHALSRSEGEPVERRAFLLVIAGSMASAFGDWDTAQHSLESSVALLRTASLPTELSRSLNSLGHILLQQGAYEPAEAYLDEALALARADGSDPVGMLLNLAIVYLMQDDPDRAAAASEEVLAVSEPIGDVGATRRSDQ
jgi:tetratricopeptide (TPR) repeat protein